MSQENELLGLERWVLEAILENKPESEAAKLKILEALAFTATPAVKTTKPIGYVVITPSGEIAEVPVMEDVRMALDIAHDLNCEPHPTHEGKPHTVKPVFDSPSMNTFEVMRLVELLGAVAQSAHVLMEDAEEIELRGARAYAYLESHPASGTLSKALDACDMEPDIGDQYVRPGWLTVLEKARGLLSSTKVEQSNNQAPVVQLIAIPEGWKLVPVKATEQMCLDAYDADLSNGAGIHGEDAARVYDAMLASAPTANAFSEQLDELILIPDHPTDEMVQAALDSGMYHDDNAKAVLIDEFRTMANAGKIATLKAPPAG